MCMYILLSIIIRIISFIGKKGQRTFVWIVDKLKGHSKSSSVEFPLIHNDLENSFEQSVPFL